MLISIVSANNLKNTNNEKLKALPNSKEVIETLVGDITDIEEGLENALKSISEDDFVNKTAELLLSLSTSIDKAIAHQILLRDTLKGVKKQKNHALAALKTLIDEGGDVISFVDKFIKPLLPTLKNLIPKLNELAESGFGEEEGIHHGGNHADNHGGSHADNHGGNHADNHGGNHANNHGGGHEGNHLGHHGGIHEGNHRFNENWKRMQS